MQAIVDELRRLTAAPEGRFDGEALEAALAARVSDRLIQRPVQRQYTIQAGSKMEVRTGAVRVAGVLDAEGAVVLDTTGAILAGEDVTVRTDGSLEFVEDMSARSLLVTGLAYDVNAAAADVLTSWAAMVAERYDVTLDGQALKRSQMHAQLLRQAGDFRVKGLIGTVSMKRHDVRRLRR